MSAEIRWRHDLVDRVLAEMEKRIDLEVQARVRERSSPNLRATPDDMAWLTARIAHHVSLYRQSGAEQVGGELTEVEAKVVTAKLGHSFHPDGPLAMIMSKPDVSEIHILIPDRGWAIGAGGKITQFTIPDGLRTEDDWKRLVINKWVARGKGGPVNASLPIKTIVLPESRWRIHIALSDVSDPPALTMRKQQIEKFKALQALVDVGAFPSWVGEFFAAMVQARLNMLIAGGMGSGKTTLMRVLAATAGLHERILSIEDTPELYLRDVRPGSNTVALTSREPNAEGKGGIDMSVLAREILRMSPDRAFVGEVRGKEAFPMVQAMSSGVDGSACTLHAQSARMIIPRLVTYMLEHPDQGKDEVQAKKTVSTAIDLLVYMRRFTDRNGMVRRLLHHVAVPLGYENGDVKVQVLFEYQEATDSWRWTGPRPEQAGTAEWKEKLREHGVDLSNMVPASALGLVAAAGAVKL